jgi:hypothetical protein
MAGNFKGLGRIVEGICYFAGKAWEDCSRNCKFPSPKGDLIVLFALYEAVTVHKIV